MYSKLLKNFIFKNFSLFLFLFFAIFISLFGFIFTDSLSKNFLWEIQADSKKSLGWDITVTLQSDNQKEVEEFFQENISPEAKIAQIFNIRSSAQLGDEIISANILFYSKLYPFYDSLEIENKNNDGKIIISDDLYNRISEEKKLKIFDKDQEIYGTYKILPSQIDSFLSSENIFIPMEYFAEIIPNQQSLFLEKKYFIQTPQNIFESTNELLETQEKNLQMRVRDYISGGERFEDIVKNIVSYINASVLFALLLTSVIIYLSMRGFFIKQRKDLAILRVLWFQNKQFIWFFSLVFGTIFLLAGILSWILVEIGFIFLQTIEETQWFWLQISSLYEASFVAASLWIIWLGWPIYQFISQNPLNGFKENFFSGSSKLQKFILFIICNSAVFLFALLLDYSLFQGIIITLWISVFLWIFTLFTKWINIWIFKIYSQKKSKNFEIFDALRNTLKPGNLTFLLNISFFVIFFVWFAIFLLFWNFYNRLQVNLWSDNNLFVLNIDQKVYDKIDENFKDETYSTFRGRISEINGQSLKEFLWDNSSGRFSREFNITDNLLKDIAIEKWQKIQSGSVSVDKNFSEDLWIKLWDEITFQIFGLEKTLEVINIRQSQNYAITPFFYFQVFPQDFEKFPKQYFLSTQVESDKIPEVKQYFFDLSNGSTQFIEVEKILAEVKEISLKVLGIIQILFLYLVIFCILSIIVVTNFYTLFAKQKSKLYYLLGSTNKQNQKREFFEYFLLGVLMFVLAILIATASIKYFLWINDFIIFDWNIWLKYIFIFIIIFLILMAWIWKFIQKK